MTCLLLFLLVGTVPPFSARFERVIIERGTPDTARGRICFVAPWRIYYLVDYPLDQQLSVVKNTMTIYYPEQNSGFVIQARSRLETPLSQQSILAEDPRKTMSRLGFGLAGQTVRNDTTYAVWRPKRPGTNPLARVVFGRCGGRHVLTRVIRKDDRPLSETWFGDYVFIDTFALPTRIEHHRFADDGSRTEHIMTYTMVDTSTAFIDSLGSFRVPNDAEMKRMKW
ncbi:MAG: hypothetical protein JSU73_01280 [candidate division WOR-3 bacterium]|nr:MAG: hypothetical protein JSU73_01280 [candidate division WOR-3 bacterium]